MNISIKDFAIFSLCLLTMFLSVYLVNLYKSWQDVLIIKENLNIEYPDFIGQGQLDNILTRKKMSWHDLQQQIKDSVVQVINQRTEFNWLEPFKAPGQGESYGSAF